MITDTVFSVCFANDPYYNIISNVRIKSEGAGLYSITKERNLEANGGNRRDGKVCISLMTGSSNI